MGRDREAVSTRACISVLRAIMCADGPERMLSDARSALTHLLPDHSWHPWALLVQGVAHVLLGEAGSAEAVLAEAADASERLGRTECQALALCERSLLATPSDDQKAEALALQARHLIEDSELDAYATSALELAISARTLLRKGQWDDARRQLTIARRLAPSMTHAIPNAAFCRGFRSEASHFNRYPKPFGPLIRIPPNYVTPIQFVHRGLAIEYGSQCDS